MLHTSTASIKSSQVSSSASASLQKIAFTLSFSSCLSRACLGKVIVVSIKVAPKKAFSAPLTVRQARLERLRETSGRFSVKDFLPDLFSSRACLGK
eukprot:COSAG06_NODE_3295_length_5545_cov_1.506427_2_plen_96_part_00